MVHCNIKYVSFFAKSLITVDVTKFKAEKPHYNF